MLDLLNVLGLKALQRGEPRGERSGEQHPLNHIQRQIRGGVRRTVPLGGVLKLPAAAVPSQRHTAPEVWLCGALLWLEAHEDAPWAGEGGCGLIQGAPFSLRVFRLVLTQAFGVSWFGAALV